MSIRIPKKEPEKLTKEQLKAAREPFKPGAEHQLSDRSYKADDTGAWRRQTQAAK